MDQHNYEPFACFEQLFHHLNVNKVNNNQMNKQSINKFKFLIMLKIYDYVVYKVGMSDVDVDVHVCNVM